MNDKIFYFFYNFAHRSASLDRVIVFFANIFPYIVVVFAGIFLLIHYKIIPSDNPFREGTKKWKKFFTFTSAVLIAWGLGKTLKILFHTLRPFATIPGVHSLFPETGYAFPSDHTIFFAALATAIFMLNKKDGYFFIFFALIIGLARIAAGVHYPIDVLGGFIIASFVSWLIFYIFSQFAYFRDNV